MPLPRRLSWLAAMISISLLALFSFVALGTLRGPVVTAATEAAIQNAVGGQPAAPVAAGVVTFADLIRQDQRRPPPAMEPVDKPEAEERQPWENPSIDPRRVPPRSDGGSPSFFRASAISIGPSPVPLRSFEAADLGRRSPPDTMGAVGLEHVLTVTNQLMQGHTKAGALLGFTRDLLAGDEPSRAVRSPGPL